MSGTPIRQDDHGYLQESRRTVLHCIDGLDEYRLRRPMTPTGTNLLGVVKHLIGIEAGYLGFCLGRPFPQRLPWIEGGVVEPNIDMWATADEPREALVQLYRDACARADHVLAEVRSDDPATVPWWPKGSQSTTAAALLARVLKDTAMHAGQLQILRELIDGVAGADRDEVGSDDWWHAYTVHLEQIARRFGA